MRSPEPQPSTSARRGSVIGMTYAALCYAAFFVSFLYFIGFTNGLLVPKAIDDGAVRPVAQAVLINLGLILLWGLQHSVMARARFKAWWTRIIPAHTERATYCAASAVALMAVCVGWAPIEGTVWSFEGPVAIALWVMHALGWAILFAASFEIDHFELFGLKQPYLAMRGRDAVAKPLQQRFLYRVVRHPIQLGVGIGMWVTPTMTVGHLLFAVAMSAYIMVGLHFEERALVREFGDAYRAYQRRVPKVLPWPRPKPEQTRSDAPGAAELAG